MGDHRDVSADSRCHLSDLVPAVPRGRPRSCRINIVVGPAFAIAAPFNRAQLLKRPATFDDRAGPDRTRPGRSGDHPRERELLMSTETAAELSVAVGQVQVRRNSGIYGYERALKRVGLDPVAGADEAGRGACAGPLVAAATILSDAKSRQITVLPRLQAADAAQRERAYAEIVGKAVAWSVVVIEPEECDRLGMHVANVLALRRALLRLEVPPTYVLTDGFRVDGLGVPGLAVWKGDRVAACVAAASIIAKVTRDRIMAELDERLSRVRVRDPQGLLHRSCTRSGWTVRALGHAPDAVRQRVAERLESTTL